MSFSVVAYWRRRVGDVCRRLSFPFRLTPSSSPASEYGVIGSSSSSSSSIGCGSNSSSSTTIMGTSSHSSGIGIISSSNNSFGSNCYVCSRRFFWNPFARRDGDGNKTGKDTVADQYQRIMEKAQRDATLHNERLLDACLDLLSVCGTGRVANTLEKVEEGHESNSDTSMDIIAAVVETTLHDFRKTPSEQFDLVYSALCLPFVREDRHVQRCLMVVLEAILPEALFRVFESTDLIVVDPHDTIRREALLRLVHALLGAEADDNETTTKDHTNNNNNTTTNTDNNNTTTTNNTNNNEMHETVKTEEEPAEVRLVVYVSAVRDAFPALQRSPAFAALAADATGIAMRARLYLLLGRLCGLLDGGGTGTVALADLRDSARRVLGDEGAARLLQGARPDERGRIRYRQLMALITRPPPTTAK